MRSCIVDGEAIAVDENGLSVFDLVRNSAKTESSNASAGSLICYVGRTMAWLNEHYRGDGAVIYKHACALGCEGIVSKRGLRSRTRMRDANTLQYNKYADLPGIISCKNAALKTPLAFDPGTRWEYGINIDFVGKAVEAVSGQNLAVYLREHVLQPLGMKDTDFVIGPDQRARLVSVHARKEDGALEPMEFGIPQEPEFFMGGGGLYGTARDYIAFLQMLLHDGKVGSAQILRPETIAEMSKNNMGDIKIAFLKTAIPSASPDVDLPQMFPGDDLKWGLSFLINTKQGPAGRSAGTLSWCGLANTYFWVDPAKRVAGVICTQILPFVDPRVMNLYAKFESGVYQAVS